MRAQHGDCFTVGQLFNRRVVVLLGVQANRTVLLDPADNFSSRWGWEVMMDFFGRNLLLRDFEDHRVHRRLLTGLFKPPALGRYLNVMKPMIRAAMVDVDVRLDAYRFARRLALDIGLEVFAGYPPAPDNEAVYRDTARVLDAVMAHRIRLPGSRYQRALWARDRLRARLLGDVHERRQGRRSDMFSQLARFEDEEGRRLSDQDVVDHMFGMLFAAHETTASAMSMMMLSFARHRDWQDKVRSEVLAACPGESPNFEQLATMPITEAVFRETLRLYAPIQLLPRRNVRPFDTNGHRIPANSHILVSPQTCHRDPALFDDPECFLPGRFLAGSAAAPVDPFAFVPFGKGSHMCIGMHFALMEVKAVFAELLRSYEIQLASERPPVIQWLPTLRPAERLPVRFVPIRASV